MLHQAGGTTVDGSSYTYDPAGNRLSKTNYMNGVTEGYSYDNLYELTQVVQGATATESYSYDAVGNRLSSLGVPLYQYNSSNELTSSSSGSYAYDANGNTLTDAQGRSFAWDFENRLVQATNPGVGTTTFKYDPLGRRIQKQSPSFAGAFVYDGPNLIQTMNSSGNEIASYTQELDIDNPLAELSNGTADYYEADGLGSITSLSGSSGPIVESYTFDSFGNTIASTGTLQNYFEYAAREFDAETSLYFNRARYFDPSIGRFLSQDPGEDGSLLDALNLYRYAQNNPIEYADPLGLYTLKPSHPPLPPPSAALDALLKCIEANTHINLIVNSTSEPPPQSPHGPNDPHRRGGGLAVDIHYPNDPDAVLNAAACCGAKNALDEKKHPSKHSNGPHLHLQLVPGPNPRNPGGDLPKNPKCKECQR